MFVDLEGMSTQAAPIPTTAVLSTPAPLFFYEAASITSSDNESQLAAKTSK